MAFGCTTNIIYLLTYLLTVKLLNALMAYKGCMGQRFCNIDAVVWIAELVRDYFILVLLS